MGKRKARVVYPAMSKFFGATLSVLLLGVSLLGYKVNSILFSTGIYIFSGILLVKADRVNGEPFYFGPGTLFWAGHFFCWVVGGWLFWHLGTEEYVYISQPIAKLRFAVTVSSLGVGTFASVYYISKLFSGRNYINEDIGSYTRHITQRLISSLKWDNIMYLVALVFVLTVLRNYVNSDGLFAYILEGSYRFARYVSYALAGLAFSSNKIGRRYKALALILILIVVFDAFVRGGRGPLMLGLSAVALAYTSNLIYNKRFPWLRIAVFSFVFLFSIIVYFRVAGTYRSSRLGEGSMYHGQYEYSVRAAAFLNTLNSSDFTSTEYYISAFRSLGNRVYEYRASELIYDLKNHKPNIDRLAKDFLFQYIPTTIYKSKGDGRNTKLLQKRDLVPQGTGAPVTIPVDAYYRFGAVGVTIVYMIYALFLSSICDFLIRRNSVTLLLIYFLILILQVRIYILDSLGLLLFFTSDLVIITLLSIGILYVSGMINKAQLLQPFT